MESQVNSPFCLGRTLAVAMDTQTRAKEITEARREVMVVRISCVRETEDE